MSCEQLERYLDRGLAADDSAAMERHVAECPRCGGEVRAWRAVEGDLKAGHASGWIPSSSATAELLARARTKRPSLRRWLLVPTLAALAVGLVAGWLLSRPAEKTAPLAMAPNGAAPSLQPQVLPITVLEAEEGDKAAPRGNDATLEAKPDRRLVVMLGNDRVAVAPAARGLVVNADPERTRVRVERGTMIFHVASRAQGRRFEVEARDHLVVVTGTRFFVSVEETRIDVGVEEGRVAVVPPAGEAVTLKAGERASFGGGGLQSRGKLDPRERNTIDSTLQLAKERLKEAKGRESRRAPEPSKAESSWQSWMESDNYEAVEMAIEGHLQRQPRDVDAWLTLAQARQRGGRWERAADAYSKVIELGRNGVANDARLSCASILQEKLEQHERAVTLLTTYLKQPLSARPKTAAAMVRLAKSLQALGHIGHAHEILRQVIVTYESGPEATEARYLLTREGR